MAIPFLSPVTTTADIRLPSNGKLFLWTGHDLNFLRYNLWQASASAGMTIKNISSSGDIYFQTNSATALTLDSNQNVIANAFTGRLQGAITAAPDSTIWCVSGQYTNWGIFYNEGSPDKIEFKAGGTVTSTIALDNGDITTLGNIYLNNNKTIFGKNTSGSNYGLLTITSGNVVKLGAYAYTSAATQIGLGDNGKFLIGTQEALSIDNSKNATFAGAISTAGNITFTDTTNHNINSIVNVVLNADSDSNSGDAYRNIIFKNRGTETGRIDKDGNATFANDVRALRFEMNMNYADSNEYMQIAKAQNKDGGIIFKSKPTGGSGQNDWQILNHSTTADLRFYAYGLGGFALTLDRENGDATFAGHLKLAGTKKLFLTDDGTSNFIQESSDNVIDFVSAGVVGLQLSGTSATMRNVKFNGHITVQTDSTFNIGSSSTRFANVYADTLHGTVALATQANNLQAFDDRDIAPEDLSFSDDLKLFFADKTGIEGGTIGNDYQDLLILSSYNDSSGGKLNALALDKSTHRILHYNANYNATNWGTAKELAYTSDVVERTGGSSNSMSGDLHIIAGGPKIYLQDNTDDDDQAIIFRNNGGSDEYKITTQDFTSAGTGDGLFIGSETTDPVKLVTNDTIALAIDSSQHISLPGAYLTLKGLSSHAQIEATSSSMFLKAVNIQAQGNLIPDGTGNRNLGASNRYWAETYTNGVTSGGNIVINSNTPILTLGVINSSTGNAKIQLYSKNSGSANGFAIQYNKDTGIDRLEFIDGGGTAAFQFHNGGNAEFEGTLTASQINTGQGATEVHLMNQNLRTTDDVTFDDLTVTGNLTITGDINSYNVTDLDITDKTITLGKGQDEGHSGGSGLIVDGSNASILWDESNDTWDFNKGIYITGNDGNVNLDGNAAIIFDNSNNNNGWYIRNGGSNAATLQFGLGTSPGSNIKHVFGGDGSVSFATYVNAATGFRMASGQAIDFIDSNIGYNSIERNTTAGGLQINTGDTNSMNILDNGRVGISTSAPESKLHVIDSSSSVQLRLNQSGDNDAVLGSGTNFFQIKTGDGGNSTALAILHSNQNIGIGTTSPDQKLEVSGGHIKITNSGNTNLYINANNSGSDASIYFEELDSVKAKIQHDASNDSMLFTDGAYTDTMTLKGAKVGIGTTSPTNPLHVKNGDSSGGNTYSLIKVENGTNHAEYGALSGYARIRAAGNEIMAGSYGATYFYNGGNTILTLTGAAVGIGTTSPSGKLQVNGDVKIGNATTGVQLQRNGNDFEIKGVDTDGNAWNSLHLKADGNTGLYIEKDTNRVGLGTVSPGVVFDIVGSSEEWFRIVGGASNINGIRLGTSSGSRQNALYRNRSNDLLTIRAGIDDSDIQIIAGGTANEIMRFDGANSRVGIGTTSPSYKLDVAGDIRCTTSLKIDAGSPFLGLYNSGTEKAYLQWSQSSSLLTLQSDGDTRFITVGTERIRIKSDGKVGIGTPTPTYDLSVAGAISGAGFVTYTKSYGSLNATGNAVAGITANANGNGSSCGFTFTCFGHTGAYQRIVYSCYNGSGTWYAKKVIDEGTNQLDVAASANGSTITFTFKATSSTMSYSPRVKVEAEGHNINSTYA